MSKILSPSTLWEGFNDSLPLKENKILNTTIGKAVFNYVYFSGRNVGSSRVRIYGVYAEQKNNNADTIIILPDVCDSIDIESIIYFSNLGFNVLSVDLAGNREGRKDFTVYPDKISYANYDLVGDTFDSVQNTAKDTCWYEWCAVARYAVSYVKDKNPNGRIGVLGIKHGANVAWHLTATDKRVDASAFAFGSGWLSYKGVYKHTGEEIVLDDERCRFLAGVDAHTFAQQVKVPIMFVSTTNSGEFDCDRAVDTVQRVNNDNRSWINFVCTTCDVVDENCLTSIKLFFEKFIKNKSVKLPNIPKIEIEAVDEDAYYYVECYSPKDVVSVTVYASSNDINPAERVWFVMETDEINLKGDYKFKRRLLGSVDFEIAYAVVKYQNGLTLSSKFAFEKLNVKTNSKIPNLIFSSNRLQTVFMVEKPDTKLLAHAFTTESTYEYIEGPYKIKGVTINNPISSFAVKKFASLLSHESFIKFDAFVSTVDTITLKLSSLSGVDYEYSISLGAEDCWQNISVNLTDFKTKIGMPIRDFSDLISITVSSNGRVAINNFLIL